MKQLRVIQPLMKFPIFYGTRRYITASYIAVTWISPEPEESSTSSTAHLLTSTLTAGIFPEPAIIMQSKSRATLFKVHLASRLNCVYV